MKSNIDEYDERIIRELIKNPRISDNQISRNTKVPLKTVNRKRKEMEKKGWISYHTQVNNGPHGTGNFGSMKMYIMRFRHGISRKHFEKNYASMNRQTIYDAKHIHTSYLGERDGHLILVLFIESRKDSDIIEIFNVDLLNDFKSRFGNDCMHDVEVIQISHNIRLLHNYLNSNILSNMEDGIIKTDWKDDDIYVN
jgi:DNA-binding Lrp family transcriptional regulator